VGPPERVPGVGHTRRSIDSPHHRLVISGINRETKSKHCCNLGLGTIDIRRPG